MPGLTGLQIIGSLENKPLVIFITAYKQYVMESYDLSVVDYLVKLVQLDRFIKTCNRAKELHEFKAIKRQNIVPPSKDYFFLNVNYSLVKVMFEDIIWMEGMLDSFLRQLCICIHRLVLNKGNNSFIDTNAPLHYYRKFIQSIKTADKQKNIPAFAKRISIAITLFVRASGGSFMYFTYVPNFVLS